MTTAIRHDWTRDEVRALFDMPLLDLVFRAAQVHREHHDPSQVQVNQLISIKTGGCPEDCGYCSQSVHNAAAGIKARPMLQHAEVLATAASAMEQGVTRICLGAAWREVKDNAQFERVLAMVRDVSGMGLEVCCTLGMLTADQAQRLEEAGLYAYNHNLDTSEEFYPSIITTRTYQDRLDTIANLRTTNITLCCGGIIGMGETVDDRAAMLQTLANLDPQPESVPINVLSKVPGTPLDDQPDVAIEDTVRMIAVARILMPRSSVRIAAGRHLMSFSDQALCFMAGASSFFTSEQGKMLTEAVPCERPAQDRALLDALGLEPRKPAVAAAAQA
ncbi:MAG TPA: biotin synthase BioB [Acidimicrobiia bacterium]